MRFLLFLLLPVLACAQRPAAPKPAARPVPPPVAPPVPWVAGRPLTVTDFQGRPAAGEPHAALTSARIDASGACQGNVFTADVRAVFDPSGSWVRDPSTITEALLRHEQLHFDIAELYARRLRLKFASARPNCVQLQGTFNQISRSLYVEWEQEENRYDQETNHGLNTVQQAVWERQTAVRIQQLAAYALKETQ
jgi:hypothetical protein